MFFAFFMTVFVSLTACDMTVDPFTNYRDPFRVKSSGMIDGTEVEAVVFCDPTEHLTKEIYNVLTVSFISPKSLDGITVSLRSDGKATVRLNDISEEQPLYAGIAEPFMILCPNGEPRRTERTEDGGWCIVYGKGEDEVIYIFSSDGRLTRIKGEAGGRKIDLNITKIP